MKIITIAIVVDRDTYTINKLNNKRTKVQIIDQKYVHIAMHIFKKKDVSMTQTRKKLI